MVWNNDRSVTAAELQREARALGTVADRAIAREIKTACRRFSSTDAVWLEVVAQVEHWKRGRRSLEVLATMQRLNRASRR